jgi:uncharacterized SAM-binding protein YcdF (DUF218 family)
MYRLLLDLTDPVVFFYLLTGLAIVLLWLRGRQAEGGGQTAIRKRRSFRALVLSFVILTLLFSPVVSHFAIGSLEWHYPPLSRRPKEAEAIVVLGGSIRPTDGARSRYEPTTDTLYRCLKAVELYRQGSPCPVVVCGGQLDPEGPAIATVMAGFLREQGISRQDLLIDDTSRNTFENAVEGSRLLAENGLGKVILVTDATHLYRAQKCFQKQGVDTIPCGCRYRALRLEPSVLSFLPSPSAAEGCQEVWHEWLGILWYRARGRI